MSGAADQELEGIVRLVNFKVWECFEIRVLEKFKNFEKIFLCGKIKSPFSNKNCYLLIELKSPSIFIIDFENLFFCIIIIIIFYFSFKK